MLMITLSILRPGVCPGKPSGPVPVVFVQLAAVAQSLEELPFQVKVSGQAFTVMVIVAVVAHRPSVGVKVYSVVAVLFIAGDQVPVTLLLEVVGKADKLAPEQMAATAVKVGVTFEFTVMVIAAVVAH